MSGAFTLRGEASLLQEVKKSRFLARGAAIETPESAAAFIARAGDPDATHNCWAWRIGEQYRFSDDGEPGGSAGKPILMAIDGQALDRVAVVVTRWYGGIKLGVGGLVRAYGGCAAECLRRADRQALVDLRRARIQCDHAASPVLRARLRDFDAVKRAERACAEGIEFEVELPAARVEALAAYVLDLTRGRGMVERA